MGRLFGSAGAPLFLPDRRLWLPRRDRCALRTALFRPPARERGTILIASPRCVQPAAGGAPTSCKITFNALGAYAWGTTSSSPGLPAGWQADDIHLCFVLSSTGHAPSMSADWTPLPATDSGNSSAKYPAAWWRRAVGGDGAPTVTATSGSAKLETVIAGYRGCIASGSPIDVAGSAWDVGSGSSGYALAISGITTVTAYDMVVAANWVGAASGSGCTFSWTAGWAATVFSFTDSGHNLMSLGGTQEAFAAAGPTGACTATNSQEHPSFLTGIQIALKTS